MSMSAATVENMGPSSNNIIWQSTKVKKNTVDIKIWGQKDNAACCCIVSSIEESNPKKHTQLQVSICHVKEMSIQYEQTVSENKHYRLQRFIDYSYQQGHRMMDHNTFFIFKQAIVHFKNFESDCF